VAAIGGSNTAGNRSNARTLLALGVRARRGDAEAFACLAAQHQPALAAFCRRLLGESGLAEDLAQETLLRAYQSLPRLEEPSRFGAWLFGIAASAPGAGIDVGIAYRVSWRRTAAPCNRPERRDVAC
jgi:predicted RNA polymerase sigma factor